MVDGLGKIATQAKSFVSCAIGRRNETEEQDGEKNR